MGNYKGKVFNLMKETDEAFIDVGGGGLKKILSESAIHFLFNKTVEELIKQEKEERARQARLKKIGIIESY